MIPRSALGANPSVVWRWTSCTPSAPAQARAALRCALDQLGYDGEVISDAVLAVSEFVANATEHAVGPSGCGCGAPTRRLSVKSRTVILGFR